MKEHTTLKWAVLERGRDGLPRTAKMSVFVKCLYNENFTVFFLSLRVFIVCAKLIKM